MPKFIITWDVGYGSNSSVVECEDFDTAQKEAYEAAREDFENQATYIAEEYTTERAEDLGAE